MRKFIFNRAWSLFKRYSITFSQALIKAWNDYKRELVAKAFQKIPSTGQFAKKKKEAENAWRNFPALSFECTPRIIVDNSGAAAYYNTGVYNGD